MRQFVSGVIVVLCLSACSIASGPSNSASPRGHELAGAIPAVAQKGGGTQWVQFHPHTFGALYSAIVAGSDGNIWFLDENAGALVRMTMGGGITEFSLSGVLGDNAVSMAVGADGKFYISDESTSIARVTTTGSKKSFAIPSGDNTAIDGIGLGPDGNVWFTEFNHIGKITPTGTITEFAYPTQPGTNQYGGVTAGSDGNVWYAESSQNAIGKIVPSTGKIKMFPISGTCIPAPVVLAKDNNVWFACLTSSPQIGRITPTGTITIFPIGGTFNSNETEQFGARGPDGNPWFASGNDNTIFKVSTSTHTATIFIPPLASGERPDALAAGPDGNIWVDTVGGGNIDVLVIHPMTVTPTTIKFTGAGQMKAVTVAEPGVTSWTATSSNTAVATVAAGSTNSTFIVTSVAAGTCNVKVSDPVKNFVEVHVSVP